MGGPAQRRIVVGVSGSLNSVVALQRAGVEARLSGRRLLAVLVWRPKDTDPPRGSAASAPKGTRRAAMRLLADTLNDVFGATDHDVQVEGLAMSGTAGRTLVQIARRDDDLLVVGGGHRRRLRRWRSPVARYCLTHASCPVLVVPPSPLQLDLEAMTGRKLLLRGRGDDPVGELRRAGPRGPEYTDGDR